jgi:chitosanase
MISLRDKCFAIVAVFEGGKPTGGYDTIADQWPKDPGGISFGRHQASLNSGNLGKLIEEYSKTPGAQHQEEATRWVALANAKRATLNHNDEFKESLRNLAKDPIMWLVQENFFAREFFNPAYEWANNAGFGLQLSYAVVYDSWVHGSFLSSAKIARRVPEPKPFDGGDEQKWITRYLTERQEWLSTHPKSLLRKTVYRPEFFLGQAEISNWNLELPFIVHGRKVTAQDFAWPKGLLNAQTPT